MITVEVYTNGHANSDGLQNMQATSLSHLFLFVREIVTLFWQNLRLFVSRYLTCKLGLATGRILQGFMDPYLLPSVLMATGIRLILSLCSALHCSSFRYNLFGFFRYMPLKSTLFRKIISPKSYEFAHLPANQVCPEKYPKKHLYRDLK